MEITAAGLVAACGNESEDAGIRVRTRLEPLAGPLTPVKPPTYLGARYQEEHRWWDGTESTEPVRVVMIDSIASQANRLEAALEQEAGPLGLPQVVLDLSGIGSLPSHVPSRLSGFRFPHRQADAYLRDAVLDGQGFPSTEMGRDILGATAERPEALLRWFPQALLFGFWQSHLGKKRSQAKLARSWFSEIVGYVPAETGTRQLGTKGDPLNLSTDEAVQYEDTDLLTGWELVEGTKRASGSK
ncbi:MAG: type I-G CRISPR-associated RAMP protein Csb1/Cas7g, partial [Acidimicrobiales bacterium]